MILLGRSSSIIWTGLLITGAGIAWASDKKGNESEEDDKWATPDNTVTLAQLTSKSDKLSRRSSGKFVGMKDQCTGFVEAANLGVGKASDGKLPNTKQQVKNFRQNKGNKKAPRTKSVGSSTYPYKNENQVCGVPICVEVDMVPKRFRSLCSMAAWMKENNHNKRVFMVQKGDCAKIIDNKSNTHGKKISWFMSSKAHGNKKCLKTEGCNTEICINDNGNAKTFPNVFQAYMYMRKITKTQVITVGLGSCSKLYNEGCIYTEWFDLDDPMSDDVEEESVPYAHMMVLASDIDGEVKLLNTTDASGKNKKEKDMGPSHLGIHRSCPPSEIMDTQYMTNSGERTLAKDVPGYLYKVDPLKLKCRSSDNKKKIDWEYSYFDDFKKNVTCRDWKVRYCCKEMWGEAIDTGGVDKKNSPKELKGATEIVKVDKPERKSLFEGCEWKALVNTPADNKTGSDNELKSTLLNHHVRNFLVGSAKRDKNFCKGFALGTRFIDVRVEDDTSLPYDEVKNQTILKISAVSGFMCKGKDCKDYNVRYCCVKGAKEFGDWAKWGKWSKCDRECGGGYRHRTRKCKEGIKCYEASDSAKRQEEPCNQKSCKPGETKEKFTKWGSWKECDASCGKGKRKRYRECIHEKGCGKLKFGEKESQEGDCKSDLCPEYVWGTWSVWAGCDGECGKVQTAQRLRKCTQVVPGDPNPRRAELNKCPGGAAKATEAGKTCKFEPCKQDGGWGEWGEWLGCKPHCKKIRTRECNKPPQKGSGKPCKGASFEEEKCELNAAAGKKKCQKEEPCIFSDWGPWSSCSQMCGTVAEAKQAVRSRHRHIIKGTEKDCKDDDIGLKEVGPCVHCQEKGSEHCINKCPSDCEYKQWNPWTSKTGVVCKRCKPLPTKHPEKMWRTRGIKSPAQEGGLPCENLKEEVTCKDVLEDKKCSEMKQGVWGDWSGCQLPKGKAGKDGETSCHSVHGKQTRYRGSKNKKKGKTDERVKEEKDCLKMCPDTDPYSSWTEWSECSGKGISKEKNGQKCGTGHRHRSRHCHKYIKKDEKALKKFCRHGENQKVKEKCGYGECGHANFE